MLREMVPLEAERADPDLGGEIDLTEGIEAGETGLASERRVREGRDLGVAADRGDRGGDWDHALARFHFGSRPRVPGHSDSVDRFGV